ncbi:hypothetical protein D3C78_1807880 [compost metagenome]
MLRLRADPELILDARSDTHGAAEEREEAILYSPLTQIDAERVSILCGDFLRLSRQIVPIAVI